MLAQQKPRFITVMIVVCVAFVSPAGADTVTIIDSLGDATPHTHFQTSGAGGQGITTDQFVGPEFTLTEPTVLTEIGAFVNNCKSIISGRPLCPNTLPFTVQIRPSINGVPDTSTVLATFILSHNRSPVIISYESVTINFALEAGTYFALFAPQDDDAGFLLDIASTPFNYQAESITLGFLIPSTGISFASQLSGAVRILGSPIP